MPPSLIDRFSTTLSQAVDRLKLNGRLRAPKNELKCLNLPKSHAHAHPEIFYQLSGRTQFTFPNETMDLHPGEILLMPPAFPHAESAFSSSEPFCHLVFMLMGAKCQLHYAHIEGQNAFPTINEAISWKTSHDQGFHFCLSQAIKDLNMKNHSSLGHDLISSLFALIIKDIHKMAPKGGLHPLIHHAINIIHNRVSYCDMSIQSIAKSLSCHPDYLASLFKQDLGIAPSDYLQKCRIDLAKKLLNESPYNVEQISQLCGYRRSSYFSTSFRRMTGKSPLEFRKQVIETNETESFTPLKFLPLYQT